MPLSATLLNPVSDWLVGKALDGLANPITKWWATRRVKRKVRNAFTRTVVETHRQYWPISWLEVIEGLSPILQAELEKLISAGEDPDEHLIGAALCKNARGPLNLCDVGRFFIERMEDNLLPISDLTPILSLRHTYKSRRASEQILDELRRPLQTVEPIPLLPQEEQRAELALARRAPGLLEWPQVLPDGVWLDRPELITLIETINTKPHSTTILLGSPGSGKSALLARLGNHFKDDGVTTVIAIKADQISATIKTDEDLGTALGLDGPAMDTISRLSTTNKILLLVDQMDAVADLADLHTSRLNALIDLITGLFETKNIHIVASARTFEFNHDPRFVRMDAQHITLTLPAWTIVGPILQGRGLQTATWSSERQDTMRAPQTLSTFLGLAQELGATGQVAQTYQGMLEQIWDMRLADPQLRTFVSRVAKTMADREELSLPIAMFDGEADLLERGIHAGIFLKETDRSTFQFVHQTLFDHAVARSFMAEGASLLAFITNHQESLSSRPRIWAVLTYLRETSPAVYQDQLHEIWSLEGLRYHLKCLLVDFLGAREIPHPFEHRIMLEGFAVDNLVYRGARAIAGNTGWFPFARDHLLPGMMDDADKRLDAAIMLLQRALPFARDDVLALIETNWPRTNQVHLRANVLRQLENWNDAAIRLAEPIADDPQIVNWTICELASVIGASCPDHGAQFAVRALRAKTEELKQKASDANAPVESEIKSLLEQRGTEGWYELAAIPQTAPDAFLREAAPWFLEVADICTPPEELYHGRYREGSYIGHFNDDESRLHESDIVAAMQVSLNGVAQNDLARFLELTVEWRVSDIMLLHRMMARAFLCAGNGKARAIADYLIEDPRRLYLGNHFEIPHLETKRLITAVGASGEREEIDRVFDHLKDWSPAQTNWVRENAENLRHWTQSNRRTRLQLLSALADTDLLPVQRHALAQLHRACPDFLSQRDTSGGLEFTEIKSPMSHEQMVRAHEADILKLLTEFPDDYERAFLGPSSHTVTWAFGEFAKAQPLRAMSIVNQLPVDRYTQPVTRILAPIAGSNDISFETFFTFAQEQINRGHLSSDFMEALASAAKSAAEKPCGIPDAFLNLFRAQLHDVPVEETGNGEQERSEAGHDQSILWGMDGIAMVPHGNYSLLSAIWWGYILREPLQGDEVLEVFMEHLERDDTPGTWQHLALFDLRFLHLCPQEQTVLFMNRLFERYPQVLGSAAGTMLIGRACHWASEEDYRSWCDTIRVNDWAGGKQAYGELLTLRAIIKPNEVWCRIAIDETLHNVADDENGERLGIAFATANLWHEAPYRATLTPYLISLLACEDLAVRKAVTDTFRLSSGHIPADQYTRKFLTALHKQGVFGQDVGITFVTEALTDLVFLLPDEVHALARDIVDMLSSDTDHNTARKMQGSNELNHVAISLTGLGGKYRVQGIQLFEDLLRNEAYGAEDLLNEIDGIRANASFRPPRRLRRRRR